jgi:TRAP-type C4-dicarboxylate transport system permease small subunit
MDELDLLKQDWKRQEKNLPHLESDEICIMMHKKSTSIVKWIFIISIAEFLFWIGIESLSLFDNSYQIIKEIGLEFFYKVSLVINYVAIFIFIYLFYRNYKRIKTDDSIKVLMRNIIITRKTVKAYVWFNLIFFSISFLISGYMSMDSVLGNETVKVKLISLAILIGALVVILLLIIGFYVLLYGILTKRLYKNYKILKNIERDN